MANLGDAFKKAGLVSEKDERRRKHAERVHRKKVGRSGLEAEERERQKEREARRARQKEEARRLEKKRRARVLADEEMAKLRDLIRTHSFPPPAGGRRRFHYRDEQGHLPYLLVDEEGARRLETGQWAIVRCEGRACLIARSEAEIVRGIRPDRILFWAGGQPRPGSDEGAA